MSAHLARALRIGACLSLVVSTPAFAVDFAQYREFRLGSSAASVAAATRTLDRDLKTTFQRPALLQELSWRPNDSLTVTRTEATADPVRDVAFSFVDDQLFRIVVAYDRSRTHHLTPGDMIAALTGIYGAPSRLPARRAGTRESLDSSTLVAHWQSETVTVALQHREYAGDFALVVTSVPLERLARTAQASAVLMDAREAPAREAALLRKQADDAREEAARIRSRNKDGFRP